MNQVPHVPEDPHCACLLCARRRLDEASPGDPVDALTNCVRWIETIREPLRRRQIARALAAYFDEVA